MYMYLCGVTFCEFGIVTELSASLLVHLTGSPAAIVVEPETDDDGILHVFNRDIWKRFEVDRVFGPSSTQEQVGVS